MELEKKYVGVQFKGGEQIYTYFSFIDVKVGDSVVVETRYGEKVAKVATLNLSQEQKNRATAYIIDIIKMDKHEEAKEKEIIKKELLEKIEKRAKAVIKDKQYMELAEHDAILADLLKQFKEYN